MLSSFRAATLGGATLLVVCSTWAVAQAPAPPPQPRGTAPSLAAPVAYAQADPAPYTRYTPGACAQTPRAELQYWRSLRPDTIYHRSLGNPLVPANVAASKACVARFSVATLAPEDLSGFAAAALAADEDTKADSALRRWVASVTQTTPAEQGWAMAEVVRTYTEALPARMAAAWAALARLDALGAAWAPQQLLARGYLFHRAGIMDDLTAMDTLTASSMVLAKSLVGDTAKRYDRAIESAFYTLADVQSRHGEMDKARATLNEGFSYVKRFSPSASGLDWWLEWRFKRLGKPVKPVAATQWIHAGGDTVLPIPGHPILLVEVGVCTGNYSGGCHEGYAALRRLMAKHPTLSVALMIEGDGTYGARLVPPDSEAILKADYFAQQGLTVPIAFWYKGFTPRPDGRRDVKPSPNRKIYGFTFWRNDPVTGFLVDGSGMLRRAAILHDSSEAMFDREIREVLERKASPPLPATPATATPAAAVPARRVSVLDSEHGAPFSFTRMQPSRKTQGIV